MGYASAGISNSPNYRLDMNTWLTYQDVSGNFSDVSWNLILVKLAGSGYQSNAANQWSANVHGEGWSGTYTYNFTQYSQLTLAATGKRIYHNADGTASYGFSGYATMSASRVGGGGSANPGSSEGLPTIPRASTATFDGGNWMNTGATVTIRSNRASSGFTHDVDWYFGNASGRAVTGLQDTASWTVPMSLLDQIPNATSGVGKLRTHTYSGGTMIGITETAMGINVPASVVPTFPSFTISEETASVIAAGIGGYVQNVSTLDYAIATGAGAYGSTISQYQLLVGAVAKSGQSGISAPIAASGSVVITARITDSRGRTAERTQTINVLPYSGPQISGYEVLRADASGFPDPDGDHLRIELNTQVTSLIVGGVQKNTLTYRTRTKVKDGPTWTTVAETTAAGITYNSFYVISPYAEDSSWDVRVEVFDKFLTSAAQTAVAVAAILMHWDESGGVGIGKFHENGGLDVAGDIYHRNGAVVEPVGVILDYAGDTAPAGWLLCNGSTVSRSTYADLFDIIGTKFGAGNGTTTFTLPDFRGRVAVGRDAGQTEFDVLGEVGGAKTHTLTEGQMPSHTHSPGPNSNGFVAHLTAIDGTQAARWNTMAGAGDEVGAYRGAASAGGNQAHNNLQPYVVTNKIIKS